MAYCVSSWTLELGERDTWPSGAMLMLTLFSLLDSIEETEQLHLISGLCFWSLHTRPTEPFTANSYQTTPCNQQPNFSFIFPSSQNRKSTHSSFAARILWAFGPLFRFPKENHHRRQSSSVTQDERGHHSQSTQFTNLLPMVN